MQQSKQLKRPFIEFVTHLFRRITSAFIVILGRRGTGKTDLALLMAQILHDNGVIEKVATNIKIYNSPFEIKLITNLHDLKQWASKERGKKLFIFDEIGKGMRRRTPMSRLNIKLIDQFHILRKYKLSIIATTISEQYVDRGVLGTDILDGYFVKPSFRNRKIASYVDFLEDYDKTLVGIPSTYIEFDTWDSAPFDEYDKTRRPSFKDKDIEILWDWAHGKSIRDLGLHPMKLNRLTRKFVKDALEKTFHISQA